MHQYHKQLLINNSPFHRSTGYSPGSGGVWRGDQALPQQVVAQVARSLASSMFPGDCQGRCSDHLHSKWGQVGRTASCHLECGGRQSCNTQAQVGFHIYIHTNDTKAGVCPGPG
jgi:hypothetical protein